MQGFNRYYPPDFDPAKTETLNAYHGKHALGDRARKIDKGILIVRFELPFNIWCGTCDAHIGAGVRYNAEKKKEGNYLSTPIYGFRCKCHLCSGWFEIRTDPKNAAYVVHSGARRKAEDWDPAENGGYAVQDTEQPSTADPDAFSQLEKTETQLSLKKSQSERLTDLYALSASTTADPYTLSSKLRRSFRAGKKVREQLAGEDADLRNRIGLGERVKLLEGVEGEGSAEWRRARVERERLMVEKGKAREEHPGDSDGEGEGGGNVVVKQLAKVVRGNERRRLDPFGRPPLPATSSSWSPGALGLGRSLPAPRKVTSVGELVKMGKPPLKPTVRVGVGRNGKDRRSASPPPRLQGLVDGYGSDD